MDHLANILKNTYTLSGLRRHVRILKDYLINKIFTQNQQPADISAEDGIWLNSLGGSFINQFNKDNIYPIFDEIDKSLDKMSALNIYLPFPQNDQIQAQIGQFIFKTFGKTILFDIKFDPNLIAGCALSWQGIYKDYSLRKRIEDNKAQIIGSFKKYLKT